MKPIAAFPYKSGFVVVGDDGSVSRYTKKRWIRLTSVPGTDAAVSMGKKMKKKKLMPEVVEES